MTARVTAPPTPPRKRARWCSASLGAERGKLCRQPSALHTMIVQEATPRFGASKRPVDAVIVVRTADPQTGDSAPFVQGLYQGLGQAGVPAVGVEQSKSDFTAKPVFQQAQLSTVDDVDLDAGKLALAIVLSQPASRADYGVNANDLLPPVTPVLTPSG